MNEVAIKKETTFGAHPAAGPERTRLSTLRRLGQFELLAHAVIDCECGGRVDSAAAMTVESRAMDLTVVWTGVPCSQCAKTYTIEMKETVADPKVEARVSWPLGFQPLPPGR